MAFQIILWAFGLTSISIAYIYYKLTYWKRKYGFPNAPEFMVDTVTKPLHQCDYDLIRKYKSKFVGTYEFLTPNLLTTDAEVAHRVLVRDFHLFTDQRHYLNDDQPCGESVVFVKHNQWRHQRVLLTPGFTTLKLKNMLPIFEEESKGIVEALYSNVNKTVNIREFAMAYTIQCILRSIFSVKLDVLHDKSNPMLQHSLALFGQISITQMLAIASPFLAKIFGFQFFNKGFTNFFTKFCEDLIEKRKHLKIKGEDLMQSVLDARDAENENKNSRTVNL